MDSPPDFAQTSDAQAIGDSCKGVRLGRSLDGSNEITFVESDGMTGARIPDETEGCIIRERGTHSAGSKKGKLQRGSWWCIGSCAKTCHVCMDTHTMSGLGMSHRYTGVATTMIAMSAHWIISGMPGTAATRTLAIASGGVQGMASLVQERRDMVCIRGAFSMRVWPTAEVSIGAKASRVLGVKTGRALANAMRAAPASNLPAMTAIVVWQMWSMSGNLPKGGLVKPISQKQKGNCNQ